jgi:elongator complex protein 3
MLNKTKIIKQFFLKIKNNLPKDQDGLEALKRKILGKSLGIISNTQLLAEYKKIAKNNKAKVLYSKSLENLLRKRKIRTLSGIATVAIFTKPYPCPGRCLYCPTQPKMPKSYLSNEPAVMRAILCKYDPKLQIWTRLQTLNAMGHPTDKIELIVMGGTFNALPKSYQLQFIINCFKACNKIISKISNFQFPISNQFLNSKITPPNLPLYKGRNGGVKNLEEEQRKNEKAKHKIVGLTLETRPDYINEDEIKWMRALGATRIELGVQNIYDDVLKFNQRGHLINKTIKATKLLKDAGFKINYHLMPNLPKSTMARDLKMFKELFKNPNFQPDMLKIYPCVLTKNALRLKSLWEKEKYKPYSDQRLINLLIKIKQQIPPYVRIMRLGRDIPAQNILAGSKISNIREAVADEMTKRKIKCKCIRCREIKQLELKIENYKLRRMDYNASLGKEIFLSYEDVKKNKLIAFLRLRIPSQYFSKEKYFIPELQNTALIREIHTYGQMVEVGKKLKSAVQHFGFGKRLVSEAEKTVQEEFGIKKIAAISGVGVRNFWRKLKYKLSKTYMVKFLK